MKIMADRLLASGLAVLLIALPWLSAFAPRVLLVLLAGTGLIGWILGIRQVMAQRSRLGILAGACWLLFILIQAVALLFTVEIDAGDRRPGSAVLTGQLPAWLPGTVAASAHRDWLLCFCGALGIGFWLMFSDARDAIRRQVLPAFWLSALIVLVAGLVGRMGWLLPGMPEHHSVFQPFEYRNHGAMFIFLGLCIGAAQALRIWPRRRILAVMVGLVSFGAALALPFSGSRIGLLALLVFSGAILLWSVGQRMGIRRRTGRHGWIATLGLASALVISLAVVGISALALTGRLQVTRMQLEAIAQERYPDLRIPAAMAAWEAAMDRPVWGWGAGSFTEYLPLFAGDAFYELRYQPETRNFGQLIPAEAAHNDLIEWLSEFGLIGLGLLVLPWFALWTQARKGSRRCPASTLVLIGGGVFLAASLYDYPLHHPAGLVALFVYWGLLPMFSKEAVSPAANQNRAVSASVIRRRS